LFKAFNVDLVHGWVVDPESERYLSSVLLNDCRNSYEGAVEFIFAADELSHGQVLSTDQQQTVYNAIALNEWLDCNATQLTEFGLRMLGTMLPSNHLCVLFRNNHFSTLFKRAPGELFILCTDAGVAGDDRIVWESLRDVHQMTSEFLDSRGDFVQEAAPHTTTDSSQIDEDYALALSLQEEEDRQIQRKDDRQKLQVRQQDKM
ncbi:hypothetical protein GQ54DRAFT_239460, partial [Martensiomyces pterosporus]